MSFAAGLLQGVADGKNRQNDRKQRERELSILEAMAKNRPMENPRREGVAPSVDGAAPVSAEPYSGPISDRASHAYNRFVKEGVPPHAAAALVGNLMQESGPDINPAAVGDNGNAYGAAQWNGPRMRAYQAFAKERGVGYDDFDAQIDYLMHEGKTSEKGAWGQIMASPDVETATRLASEKFWRPGTPHLERRLGYAQSIYGKYGQAAPASSDPAPAATRPAARPISIAPAAQPEPPANRWASMRKAFGSIFSEE